MYEAGWGREMQTDRDTDNRQRQTDRETDIRKLGPGYKTSETCPYTCSPSDTLSPESLYLLKALYFPQTALPTGDQIFKSLSLQEVYFHSDSPQKPICLLFNLKRVSILHYEYLASDIIFDVFTRCLNFVNHHFGGTWISVDGTWV